MDPNSCCSLGPCSSYYYAWDPTVTSLTQSMESLSINDPAWFQNQFSTGQEFAAHSGIHGSNGFPPVFDGTSSLPVMNDIYTKVQQFLGCESSSMFVSSAPTPGVSVSGLVHVWKPPQASYVSYEVGSNNSVDSRVNLSLVQPLLEAPMNPCYNNFMKNEAGILNPDPQMYLQNLGPECRYQEDTSNNFTTYCQRPRRIGKTDSRNRRSTSSRLGSEQTDPQPRRYKRALDRTLRGKDKDEPVPEKTARGDFDSGMESPSVDAKSVLVFRRSKKRYCRLCRSNRETQAYFQSHVLADERGVVQCPVLRAVVCPICNATGDNAHTLKYCPSQANFFPDENPHYLATRTSTGGYCFSKY